MTTALRMLWGEPRAKGAPARVWRDWVLVGVAVSAALLEGVLRDDVIWRPLVTITAIGLAPLLLWRRTHPLACVVIAFGAATAFAVLSLAGGVSPVGLYTLVYILVLVYALARWGSGRDIVVGLAVVLVAAVLGTVADYTGAGDVIGGFAVLAASAAGGAAIRYRAESWHRAVDQVRSQERVGLARELHDTVAHHVSAIAVQAQAGRTVAGTRPGAALEALSVIESEASRTLAEMRAMVGVLREGSPTAYAPQPGVADLALLARSQPVPIVDVDLAGDLAGLPPHVGTAVYRLAQEGLTNALRHGRQTSRVAIRVVEDAGSVRLKVTDDGHVDPSRPVSQGFGLLGMTERVQLLGGTLRAGPATEGGWVVDAELPTSVRR